MNQPTKESLRDQLALAADGIIELRRMLLEVADEWIPVMQAAARDDIANASSRWWHRFAWWRA